MAVVPQHKSHHWKPLPILGKQNRVYKSVWWMHSDDARHTTWAPDSRYTGQQEHTDQDTRSGTVGQDVLTV